MKRAPCLCEKSFFKEFILPSFVVIDCDEAILYDKFKEALWGCDERHFVKFDTAWVARYGWDSSILLQLRRLLNGLAGTGEI